MVLDTWWYILSQSRWYVTRYVTQQIEPLKLRAVLTVLTCGMFQAQKLFEKGWAEEASQKSIHHLLLSRRVPRGLEGFGHCFP